MSIDPIKALLEYISYPSVSTDPKYREGMKQARDFVIRNFTQIGFDVEVIETPLHPIILASRIKNPEWPHIMFYAHYDVQPADPFDLWKTPPFQPEVRDGYFYGRGVTDNKGPFIVQLTALAQLLEKNPEIPLNFTFLVEGEEEIGSPNFPAFLEKYKDRLKKADLLLISDTTSPNPQQIVITTSLRGIVGLDIEVYGPNSDLHSGLYGGPVHNPIQALTEICSNLHLPNGRVNVPGFYDDVALPEPWEQQELSKYPISEPDLKKFLDIPEFHSPEGYAPLESIRFAPTLEFNGIGGGYQGEGSKTIIPSKAFAKITCRLVANQDPDGIRQKVIQAIESRVPKGVKVKITQHGAGEP
ncbi:MAG: peptidase M20, partial [Verrucomicrobia bacterium]